MPLSDVDQKYSNAMLCVEERQAHITRSSRLQYTINLRGMDKHPLNNRIAINYTWMSLHLSDYDKDIIYSNGSQSHLCMMK